MALWLQQEEEDYCLGVWKIDETPEQLALYLPNAVGYLQQAFQLTPSVRRQQEWLAVRVLLYHLIGEEKQIVYYPTGRPYLQDHAWWISISHTKGYAAVLLSRKGMCGLDIEQFGTRICRLADRFMNAEEVPVPYEGNEVWSLLLHWSAKETLYKCLDEKDVDFREHLKILPFETNCQGEFHATEFKTAFRYTFLINYQIFPDFVMTWTIHPDNSIQNC